MNGQFDLGAISPRRYFFGLAVLLGLVFALIGGGDDETGLLWRVLVWQFQTVVPMLLLVGSHVLLLNWHWFEGRSRWLQLSLSGVAGVLLFSPLNLGLDLWLEGELRGAVDAGRQSLTGLWLEELGYMAPPVIICWLALNAPWVLGFRLQRQEPEATAEAAIQQPVSAQSLPAFIQAMPPAVRGEPLYLKAELHYLLVVTAAGKHLLLYNLRDAMSELPADLGLHCHRSYWVNRSAVRRLHRQGRQGELELLDGARIPVSRNRLKAAGELLNTQTAA